MGPTSDNATSATNYIAQLFGDPARMIVYLRAAPDDVAELERYRDVAAAHGRPVLLVSARRWERVQTPAVERVLGPPLRSWRFGSWWAVEYGRARGDPGVASSR